MIRATIVISALCFSVAARAVVPVPTPPTPPPLPAPQIAGVKAAVLLDVHTGQVLLDQNGSTETDPSGLVKLMTAYLLYQAESQKLLTPTQRVDVSVQAWHAPGSRMFLQPGLPVTVDQLTQGLLIDGGNDAAIAIAQAVAGSESGFVDLMNQEAQQLGLQHTHFVNPDGMPAPGEESTALDIARLGRDLLRKYPQVAQVAGQASYRYNKITQFNYNPLAGQKGITGLGVGLASAHDWDMAVSATQNGRSLVAVVLGAGSRAVAGADCAAMLHYGFHGWQEHLVYPANGVVAKLRQSDWSPETLTVITPAALSVVLPKGSTDKAVQSHFVPMAHLAAPIHAGQPVGTLNLQWQGKTLRSETVLAQESVGKAGWMDRLWHHLRSWL